MTMIIPARLEHHQPSTRGHAHVSPPGANSGATVSSATVSSATVSKATVSSPTVSSTATADQARGTGDVTAAHPAATAPVGTTAVAIDPDVVDKLNQCAATAGLTVSGLLRALLATQTPSTRIGDLVHAMGNTSIVYRVTRIANGGSAFLEAAHGLHRNGGINSPGWTPAHLLGAVVQRPPTR